MCVVCDVYHQHVSRLASCVRVDVVHVSMHNDDEQRRHRQHWSLGSVVDMYRFTISSRPAENLARERVRSVLGACPTRSGACCANSE